MIAISCKVSFLVHIANPLVVFDGNGKV